MSGHTPGPWAVDDCSVMGCRMVVRGDDLIATVENAPSTANANLIAAAPTLLEALEEARLIVANLPHDESLFLAKIDAAINAATGGQQ